MVTVFLFPFATIVWDELIDTLFGGTLLILPFWGLIFWKVMKTVILFSLTIVIAPIGFFYIWIRRKTAN